MAGPALNCREISGAIESKRPPRAPGVTREDIRAIAADAVADAVTKNAPRLPPEAEVTELLHSVFWAESARP